eukprot:346219-Hanusia_phi.AAC.2
MTARTCHEKTPLLNMVRCQKHSQSTRYNGDDVGGDSGGGNGDDDDNGDDDGADEDDCDGEGDDHDHDHRADTNLVVGFA